MLEGGEVLEPNDFAHIAELHVKGIDDSLPALLGQQYAARFYSFLAASSCERLFVERVAGRVESVCVTSEAPDSLNARIVRATFPSLIPAALAALQKRPFRRFLRGVLSELAQTTDASKTPEITYIFTNAQVRGTGMGKRLIERVDQRLGELGFEGYYVKTLDDPDNRALAFYDAQGFERIGTKIESGRRFVEFHKLLAKR